jgi:hypothetical protein
LRVALRPLHFKREKTLQNSGALRREIANACSAVIAGLDPAIHHLKEFLFSMDARVKPAHDGN